MKDNDVLIPRFETAYSAYGATVYRLAMVYLGRPADAEDVTQEVFLKLLYRPPPLLTESTKSAGCCG